MVYIFKVLRSVQGKAFVVRMWEQEWQAVLACELRVTEREQTVRLERERSPPAAPESEEELGPVGPLSELQRLILLVFYVNVFLAVLTSVAQFPTILSRIVLCGEKWMCWSAPGRSPAIMWRWCCLLKMNWQVELLSRLWLLLWKVPKFECAEMFKVRWRKEIWFIR